MVLVTSDVKDMPVIPIEKNKEAQSGLEGHAKALKKCADILTVDDDDANSGQLSSPPPTSILEERTVVLSRGTVEARGYCAIRNTSPDIAQSQAVPQDHFDLFSSSRLENPGFDGDSVGGGPATGREGSGRPQWTGSHAAGSDCGTASYRDSSVVPETTIQGALASSIYSRQIR